MPPYSQAPPLWILEEPTGKYNDGQAKVGMPCGHRRHERILDGRRRCGGISVAERRLEVHELRDARATIHRDTPVTRLQDSAPGLVDESTVGLAVAQHGAGYAGHAGRALPRTPLAT